MSTLYSNQWDSEFLLDDYSLRHNYVYIFFFFGGGGATLQILALVIVFKQQIPGVRLLNDLP